MVPDGWKRTQLQRVGDIILGQSPPSAEVEDRPVGFPFLQGNAEFGERYPLARSWVVDPPRTAPPDSTLVSVRAPVGDVNRADTEYAIGRGLAAIVARENDVVPSYLYWVLSNSHEYYVSRRQGSTFLAINKGDLKELPVLLPPLSEQHDIVAVLSGVDDAIAATRRVAERTKRLRQGLLHTLMTRGIGHGHFKNTPSGRIPLEWEVLPLEAVARIQTGLAKNSRRKGPHQELPYLRVANVQDGHLDLSEVKTIRVPQGKAERYMLQDGDVLLTEGGDYDKLGRGHIWRGQIEPCVHQNHVFVVRTDKERLMAEFLNAMTSSHYGKQYFLSCAKQTTNLASINSTQLRQFPALIPPLEEQDLIVQYLESVDTALTTCEQSLEALELLKRGLMRDLLTGRVRVQPD